MDDSRRRVANFFSEEPKRPPLPPLPVRRCELAPFQHPRGPPRISSEHGSMPRSPVAKPPPPLHADGLPTQSSAKTSLPTVSRRFPRFPAKSRFGLPAHPPYAGRRGHEKQTPDKEEEDEQQAMKSRGNERNGEAGVPAASASRVILPPLRVKDEK